MAGCLSCNKIGIFTLNIALPGPPHAQKRRITSVTYNLGHGQTTTDAEVAKQKLLERDYPEIVDFKNVTQSDFKHGEMGAKFIPPVFVTKIPKVAEPLLYTAFVSLIKSGYNILFPPKEHKNNLRLINEQEGEQGLYDGLKLYFEQHNNEDVMILTNQDISDPTMAKPTWHEIDALVVNCTRGYILIGESKANLNLKTLTKASSQLEHIKAIIEKNFTLNLLQKDWKIINIIYAPVIDPTCTICPYCNTFVISPARGDFVPQMEAIVNQVSIKDFRYGKDFYHLIKEILPLRVRITKGLTDLSNMNQTILEMVEKNVEEAGTAEMVAFWSNHQTNLALNCLKLNRVLLESGFSTGKTVLMLHCALQLLKLQKKVLFVISDNSREDKTINKSNCHPSLLLMKIQNQFKQLYANGEFSDLNHFHIIEENLENPNNFDALIKSYPDFHFFIDEIKIFDGQFGIKIDTLKSWSSYQMQQQLHLWVAISYSKFGFDSSLLSAEYPTRPIMNKALRNNFNIVKHVKSKKNLDSGAILHFRLNDTSKLDETPSTNNLNLTRSIEPITLLADNYMNGYEQVFDILSKGNYSTTQALFVIPWTERLGIYRCECYRIGSIQEFENHVSRIYQQSKRQLPTIYLDKFHVDAAKHWVVSSPKPNDMITDYISVGGFEHSIVVIFNSADKFEHNLAMRSTGLLIVVNLPWYSWMTVCFSDCSDPTENEIQLRELILQPMDFSLENLIFQFENCVKDDQTLVLERYILGWEEILKFIKGLIKGKVFHWAVADLGAKLEILRGLNLGNVKDNYVTVQSMVQYEMDNGVFENVAESRQISGTRIFLLLHSPLRMVALIIEGIPKLGNQDNFVTLVQDAYKETIMKTNNHSYYVAKTVLFGIYFSSNFTRESLYKKVFGELETDESRKILEEKLTKAFDSMIKVYNITENLYVEKKLKPPEVIF